MRSRSPRALVGLVILLAATSASAGSTLRLPRPTSFGEVPALTLDEGGRRIGAATVRVSPRSDGGVSLFSESRVEGGGGNRLTAELGPVEGANELVPLVEESRTELVGGRALGFLRIDHLAGLITCGSAEGARAELALPRDERVVLAPLQLLFQPLVRGEVDAVSFQVAICKGGPRVVDAVARKAPEAGSSDLVEIRYELDFGPMLSAVVRPFMPRLSLWFERAGGSDWMAFRMPLYSKGPTVVVTRAGVLPGALGLDAAR